MNTIPALQDYHDVITKVAALKDVDVNKLERLMQLQQEFLAKQAAAHYSRQMALAQSEMGPILKDSANPMTRSRYASLAAIDNAIRDIYSRHGFSISFDEVPDKDGWIHVVAEVSCGAETRRYHRWLPWTTTGIGGRAAMTSTHANMGANTYVRRALLKNIFNLSEADDDGNAAAFEAVARKRAEQEPIDYEIPQTKQPDPPTEAVYSKQPELYEEQLTEDGLVESADKAEQLIREINRIGTLPRLREYWSETNLASQALARIDVERVKTAFMDKARTFGATLK